MLTASLSTNTTLGRQRDNVWVLNAEVTQTRRQRTTLSTPVTHFVAEVQRIVLRCDGEDLISDLQLPTRSDLNQETIFVGNVNHLIDIIDLRSAAGGQREQRDTNECPCC